MNKKETGRLGENIAYKYLSLKGYLILARNHRERFYEIDIIGRDLSGDLIFFEVKTINNREGAESFINPEDNMSQMKMKKLVRGVGIFLAKHSELIYRNRGWRIDLLAVTLTREKIAKIRHYKNI